MKNEFLKIEKAVLAKLLEGPSPLLVELRRQFAACTIKDREFTGCGFFTNFSVPEGTCKKDGFDLVIGDVLGEDIPELQYGAGFLLFITDGILDCLEGFSYNEPWPVQVDEFRLTYAIGHNKGQFSLLSPATNRDWAMIENAVHEAETNSKRSPR